jgi:hypothetical protein
MPPPPAQPKIYHIIHVDRLASVVADGCLFCDATIVQRVAPGTTIGMGRIKERRLTLPVYCHPGHHVGDYVPFYFCPRSIMLYLIYRANHPDLTYRGGQGPIIHLEADLSAVVAWANANNRRWAFSLSNAGANYTQFRADVNQLNEINWPAVLSNDFQHPDNKEGKQAEFLVHQSFPWQLVQRVGVLSTPVAQQVANAMHGAAHRPGVQILPAWYY